MRLGKPGQLLIASFGDYFYEFFVPNVAYALKKQKREDVGLEVSRIYWAPKDVGRLP